MLELDIEPHPELLEVAPWASKSIPSSVAMARASSFAKCRLAAWSSVPNAISFGCDVRSRRDVRPGRDERVTSPGSQIPWHGT